MMLLNCFLTWSQNDSLTGRLSQSDTLVFIPISAIRSANTKLIERNSLLDIVAEQDTIINNYMKIVELKDKNISIYEYEYDKLNKVNQDLSNSFARRKNMNYILLGTTSISIIGFITYLIIN